MKKPPIIILFIYGNKGKLQLAIIEKAIIKKEETTVEITLEGNT
jgi:hypothetical protein